MATQQTGSDTASNAQRTIRTLFFSRDLMTNSLPSSLNSLQQQTVQNNSSLYSSFERKKNESKPGVVNKTSNRQSSPLRVTNNVSSREQLQQSKGAKNYSPPHRRQPTIPAKQTLQQHPSLAAQSQPKSPDRLRSSLKENTCPKWSNKLSLSPKRTKGLSDPSSSEELYTTPERYTTERSSIKQKLWISSDAKKTSTFTVNNEYDRDVQRPLLTKRTRGSTSPDGRRNPLKSDRVKVDNPSQSLDALNGSQTQQTSDKEKVILGNLRHQSPSQERNGRSSPVFSKKLLVTPLSALPDKGKDTKISAFKETKRKIGNLDDTPLEKYEQIGNSRRPPRKQSPMPKQVNCDLKPPYRRHSLSPVRREGNTPPSRQQRQRPEQIGSDTSDTSIEKSCLERQQLTKIQSASSKRIIQECQVQQTEKEIRRRSSTPYPESRRQSISPKQQRNDHSKFHRDQVKPERNEDRCRRPSRQQSTSMKQFKDGCTSTTLDTKRTLPWPAQVKIIYSSVYEKIDLPNQTNYDFPSNKQRFESPQRKRGRTRQESPSPERNSKTYSSPYRQQSSFERIRSGSYSNHNPRLASPTKEFSKTKSATTQAGKSCLIKSPSQEENYNSQVKSNSQMPMRMTCSSPPPKLRQGSHSSGLRKEITLRGPTECNYPGFSELHSRPHKQSRGCETSLLPNGRQQLPTPERYRRESPNSQRLLSSERLCRKLSPSLEIKDIRLRHSSEQCSSSEQMRDGCSRSDSKQIPRYRDERSYRRQSQSPAGIRASCYRSYRLQASEQSTSDSSIPNSQPLASHNLIGNDCSRPCRRQSPSPVRNRDKNSRPYRQQSPSPERFRNDCSIPHGQPSANPVQYQVGFSMSYRAQSPSPERYRNRASRPHRQQTRTSERIKDPRFYKHQSTLIEMTSNDSSKPYKQQSASPCRTRRLPSPSPARIKVDHLRDSKPQPSSPERNKNLNQRLCRQPPSTSPVRKRGDISSSSPFSKNQTPSTQKSKRESQWSSSSLKGPTRYQGMFYQRHQLQLYRINTQKRQEFMEDLNAYRLKKSKQYMRELYRETKPRWYQDLGEAERKALDGLGEAITLDSVNDTVFRTRRVLVVLGLFPMPTQDLIKDCISSGHDDSKRMLTELFEKTYDQPFDREVENYPLCARLLLSATLYIGLADIFAQLKTIYVHRKKEEQVAKKKKRKNREPRAASPYLQMPEKAECWFPTRKKEIFKSRLFDVVIPTDSQSSVPTSKDDSHMSLPLKRKSNKSKPNPPKKKRKRTQGHLEEALPKIAPLSLEIVVPDIRKGLKKCDIMTGYETAIMDNAVTPQFRKSTFKRAKKPKSQSAFESNAKQAPKMKFNKLTEPPPTPSPGKAFLINGVTLIKGKLYYVVGGVTDIKDKMSQMRKITGGKFKWDETTNSRQWSSDIKEETCDCNKYESQLDEYLEKTKCNHDVWRETKCKENLIHPSLKFFEEPNRYGQHQFNEDLIFNLDPVDLLLKNAVLGATLMPKRKKKMIAKDDSVKVSSLKDALHYVGKTNIAAKLPNVHLVPEIKEWLRHFMYGPIRKPEKIATFKKTQLLWNLLKHFELRQRRIIFRVKNLPHVTAFKPKRLIKAYHKKYLNFKRQLLERQCDLNKLLWASMFFSKDPQKSFRDVFNSYMVTRLDDVLIWNPYKQEFNQTSSVKRTKTRCNIGGGVAYL